MICWSSLFQCSTIYQPFFPLALVLFPSSKVMKIFSYTFFIKILICLLCPDFSSMLILVWTNTIYWKDSIFPHCHFCCNQVPIPAWFYSWAPVPFRWFLSILMPLPYCLNYCNFILIHDTSEANPPTFLLFQKIIFDFVSLFYFTLVFCIMNCYS